MLLELTTLAYCSQKIVFFVKLTITLKVTTMKTWMENLLIENIHTSLVNTGASLGIEKLKFYIWLEMTLLIGMMMYGNNLPLFFIMFPLRQTRCLGLNPNRS